MSVHDFLLVLAVVLFIVGAVAAVLRRDWALACVAAGLAALSIAGMDLH